MGVTIKQIKTALKNSGGFVSQAAKQLHITQSALSNRLAKNKCLRDIRDEIRESYLDLAESKLIKKINNDDNGAIFFYLKCQGKHRGYVEKKEVALETTNTTEVNVNMDQLSTNQIKTILDTFECKS